jgi:hypothetical protein
MAGSKKDSFETAILDLIFKNSNLANIGDATGLRGSSTPGNFYIALYTAAPTDSAQGTEVTASGWNSYARVAVARSAGGWTTSANNAYNTAAITFPQCTANSCTVVAFTINTGSTLAANDAIYWGDLTSNLAVSNGITPEFTVGDLDVYED